MAIATYKLLRSGNWGIISSNELREGQRVLVKMRNGNTRTETVDRVIWSGEGKCIASIARTERTSSRARTERPASAPSAPRSAPRAVVDGAMCLACDVEHAEHDGLCSGCAFYAAATG